MRQKLLRCAAAAFAVLFVISAVMLCRTLVDRARSAAAFEEIAEMVRAEAELEPESMPDGPAGESGVPAETPALTVRAKYAAVYEQNHDFVGWISIEGTNISYPVMQTPEDPDFYLKHAFDGSYSKYGVPYARGEWGAERSDNVVIFGHNMKDGSMFSDLTGYESEAFYRQHRVIRFDTLAGFGQYEVVVVFRTAIASRGGFPYDQFISGDEAAFDSFIVQCKSLALYDTGVSAEYGDKLLTLSTCGSRSDVRLVVVAKLIQPTAVAEQSS